MALLSTHHYDGNLKARLQELKPHFDRARSIPIDRKMKAFQEIYSAMRNPYAKQNIKMLCYPGGANYDPSNQYDASDVLWLCYEIVKSGAEDALPVLETQLAEVSLGSCSQGRTHRLFQVVSSMAEFLPR